MESIEIFYQDRSYELKEEKCQGILNDEVKPLRGFELTDILSLLKQYFEVRFDLEYFDSACESCRFGKAEKAKTFKFIEFHFYAFTKGGNFVISNISPEYTTFKDLLRKKSVVESYLVSVIVCEHCGDYTIEIECGDF